MNSITFEDGTVLYVPSHARFSWLMGSKTWAWMDAHGTNHTLVDLRKSTLPFGHREWQSCCALAYWLLSEAAMSEKDDAKCCDIEDGRDAWSDELRDTIMKERPPLHIPATDIPQDSRPYGPGEEWRNS